MNLDTQDIELIKTTVSAAVAEATSKLVTKDEFKEFRAEANAKWDSTYTREIMDLKLRERDAEIDRLWEATKANQNVLATLWENTGVRIGAAMALALQAWTLWQLFQR